MVTKMIVKNFAERLTSQVKHLNWCAKIGSKYFPGSAVCDAEGEKKS